MLRAHASGSLARPRGRRDRRRSHDPNAPGPEGPHGLDERRPRGHDVIDHDDARAPHYDTPGRRTHERSRDIARSLVGREPALIVGRANGAKPRLGAEAARTNGLVDEREAAGAERPGARRHGHDPQGSAGSGAGCLGESRPERGSETAREARPGLTFRRAQHARGDPRKGQTAEDGFSAGQRPAENPWRERLGARRADARARTPASDAADW